MTQHKKLFESVQIGTKLLKNRVGVAPLTRTSATPEGLATEQMSKYYASFARGGFGFIITEGTYTDEVHSQCYFNQPGLVNEEQADAWKQVVDAVHEEGALIFVQLQHAGAISQGNRFKTTNLAPSAVLPKGDPLFFYGGATSFSTPRAATKSDIDEVIQGFVNSAVRAKAIGFDGVEIHGANGYLLDEFLTDYTNLRTDEYGGNPENRVRLLVQVANAIREVVGASFVVGIRISQGKANDYLHKWSGAEEDARVIFSELGKTELDYIHITEYQAWQPAFSQGESLVKLAKKYSGIPIIANGQLEDPDKASDMIGQDQADLVALGKGALANHNWVNKVQRGEALSELDDKVLRPDATIKDFEIDL
ncbi:oxidoreductase [Paenibacillus gallinarum]|uniref:NADH:flavin oxidoreductase n=1 Tax=Paenibacillus gallinarum TaxID=2762232 RepID=A0ABR8T5H2_9BACL|nr:NADH:flavin oxidoreductase [Paenibacillus gallinarum]MBD7971018.1 NADH:flavin oxidoreductase [Paenibacillus gallinarum]